MAIVVICFAISGFILSEIYKSSYRIVNEEYRSSGAYNQKILLKSGIKYIISVIGSDEETGLQQWASLDFDVIIHNQEGLEITNRNIIATESEENGGIIRAVNSCETYYTAAYADHIDIFIDFKEGG